MENVSHKLASANQEKTRLKRLYYGVSNDMGETGGSVHSTHQRLDMEQKHSYGSVPATIELEEVDQSVLPYQHRSPRLSAGAYDRSGERPVQPPSPLANELGSLFWNVRLCLARLDI